MYLLAKIGVDTAGNEPDVEVVTDYLYFLYEAQTFSDKQISSSYSS